ncbi:cytochrome c oxidase assembly protein [Parablastomonas sp. CN1-191]|uniref:cytochrome c oxidase assembly protein n=1 Tax=Parablastomonas sp. CN1-191 TaxID=3400908 RepID=UPI003BF7CE4B
MILPYCGAPPVPGSLWLRWNLDPVLLAGLAMLAAAHWKVAPARLRASAMAGWAVTALALVSPLCALSVSLFSARVAQHMVMILVGAPLVAAALPGPAGSRWLWPVTAVFAAFLWIWHLPAPYTATLQSVPVYWSMHVTLFVSAVALWRELLSVRNRPLTLIAAGTAASMQMALLGAVLALAGRPLFWWHLTTTADWGLTPLADQQLGGTLMWVPGGALFLWLALRTTAHALAEPRGAAA